MQEVFIRLYREGLIYRGQRLVNWDPALHTAISDLEVISEEEQGHLWHFNYPLAGAEGHLTVATTRPETMLGDSAVAVHPEDERYAHLIGRMVQLPLCDRVIPVIADDYVDREFGTGCVKITPAHDFNDYEVGRRHGLPMINIFNDNAAISDAAPPAYRGLDRCEARQRVVADMAALGLLDKVDEHRLNVPRGDRSGVVIEPYLTDQWYVDARATGQTSHCRGGKRRYPVRTQAVGKHLFRLDAGYPGLVHQPTAVVGTSHSRLVRRRRASSMSARARKRYAGSTRWETRCTLRQDEDVLDTWFSSALWTFSTLGWPAETEELALFHPSSVLVTGFDIIFFWVARMIMMTLHLAP